MPRHGTTPAGISGRCTSAVKACPKSSTAVHGTRLFSTPVGYLSREPYDRVTSVTSVTTGKGVARQVDLAQNYGTGDLSAACNGRT